MKMRNGKWRGANAAETAIRLPVAQGDGAACETTDGRVNARMTRQSKDQDKTRKPPHKPAGREARLAAALRENLRRRKAQERGRDMPARNPCIGQGRRPSSLREPDFRRNFATMVPAFGC